MRIVTKVLAALGGGSGSRDGLEQWNAVGRAENLAVCRAVQGVIEADADTDVDVTADSRSQALASAVLDEVVALNAAGRWREARQRFDPAYRPFSHRVDDVGLRAVTILGPDRFLLRIDQGVLLVDGDDADLLDGIVTFARSQDRRWLALVIASGVVVATDLDGSPAATWTWPQDVPVDPSELTSVAISDDGRRLVIAGDEIGIWLCRDGAWTALAPRPGVGDDEDDDELWLDGSHVAISPDGRFVAYGWKDAWPGHYLDRIDDDGLVPLGRVEAVSDHPCAVHFSSDGRVLFASSRHGANGVTQALDLTALAERGEQVVSATDKYATDEYLRAYSSCELPGALLGVEDRVLWIGGAGWSHAVRFDGGTPVFTHFFGSAITGIDHDPSTGRAVVISASGTVHVTDPAAEAEPGRERGYRPRREAYLMILWDGLDRVARW